MNMKTKIFYLLLLLSPICYAEDQHAFNKEVILENTIAWSCEGQGSPTIVLIAGLGLVERRKKSDTMNWRVKG